MSSFDIDRGVMILTPEQWDVLGRMVSNHIAQRPTPQDAADAGLADLGITGPKGPVTAVREILSGFVNARARYSSRRLDPRDEMPVRDITFWLEHRCTVERYDTDGIHIYSCDAVEVPHIVLANDHLHPRPMLDDGPDSVFDTLASAMKLADAEAAVDIMHLIGSQGPKESGFVRDALEDRWSIVMRMREERGPEGFDAPTGQMTLGTSNMLYAIEDDGGPTVNPRGPASKIRLVPVLGIQVWAAVSQWIWTGR